MSYLCYLCLFGSSLPPVVCKRVHVLFMRGNQKIYNSENLATYGTQDEEKQNKNTTQYVFDTTMRVVFFFFIRLC
jgi:hypothetical protein